MSKYYYVYILECRDKSYYTGVTNNLDRRISEHENNKYKSYVSNRKPFKLVYHSIFNDINAAIDFEKKVKGWSRKKKIALINDDWNRIQELSRNRQNVS